MITYNLKVITYILKLITYVCRLVLNLESPHMRLSRNHIIDEGRVVDRVTFYAHNKSYAS